MNTLNSLCCLVMAQPQELYHQFSRYSNEREEVAPSFQVSPLLRDLLCYLVILLVSAGVYTNSLDAGFVFDDHRAILTNKDLETDGDRTVWDLFLNDFWGGSMSRTQSHKSYRPLTVLTYRYLNYWLWERRPFSYHAVNVLLHSAVSLTVYTLSRLLGMERTACLLGALLFSVHSVHTEAVANTVGRAEILSALFYMLATLVYLRGMRSNRHYRTTCLSVLLSACAMLSKEQGITSVGVCLVADTLAHWDPLMSTLQQVLQYIGATKFVQKERFGTAAVLYSFILRCAIMVVSGCGLMLFRLKMNQGSQPIFNQTELRLQFHPDRQVRMMSMGYLYAFNYWLLLCPYRLCCDWTHPSIPPLLSLSDPRNICLPLLCLGVFFLVIKLLTSREDRFSLGMAISLTIIPFVPAMGIFFRIGFIVAERVLYLPSIGHCVLVAYGVSKLQRKLQYSQFRLFPYILCLLLILTQGYRTWIRNEDWMSDLNLYKAGVKLNPANPKMHNNYGMELKNRGINQEAEKHYFKALEIEPDYADTYFNLGNLYADLGMNEDALKMFIKSASYDQMRPKTMNNLAAMYMKLGRHSEAERAFQEQIAMNPHHNMAYNNLASLYGQIGKLDLAKKYFLKALEIDPNYAEAYFNLGTLYYQMQELDVAEEHFRRCLTINPGHRGATNNLKVVLYAKKERKN